MLTRRAWGFRATALEDATYRAGIFRTGTSQVAIGRQLTAGKVSVRQVSGTVKSRFVPAIQFPAGRLAPGTYVYAIRLAAALNGDARLRLRLEAVQGRRRGGGKPKVKPKKAAKKPKRKPTRASLRDT